MGTFKTTDLSGMFEELEIKLSKLKEYELNEELEQVRSTYSTMLHYMVQGVDDPNSRKIYTDLKRRCHVIANRADRLSRLGSNEHGDKYVNAFHKFQSASLQNTAIALENICKQVREVTHNPNKRESIQEHVFSNAITTRQDILDKIFNIIWTSDVWKSSDYESLSNLLSSDTLESYEKCILVSAVTLGVLEMFDEKKMMCLFDAYLSENTSINMRALVGIVLALRTHDTEIKYFPSLMSRLSLFIESESFVSDVYVILMQLQYSKLTNKVSDKMRNDIIPSLLQSGNFKKTEFGLQEIEDYMTQNGENPEWHQYDKNDKAFSKIQEMTEMQMEGADVYMSTFHYMKSDPFFHEISNWFVPFSETHPTIYKTFEEMGNIPSTLKELLHNAPFCSSDKYSFAFMLSKIGSMGQDMLMKNMGGDISDEELKEQLKEMRSEKRKGSDISRQYIQDLYRFYMIYPFHQQFSNPFSENSPSFIPQSTKLLLPLLDSKEEALNLAEFLMRKELYQDALLLYFTLNPKEVEEDAKIWQKIGFCQQKQEEYESALTSYITAYSLDSSSLWTLKHLAYVAYKAKHFEEAEAYYDMLIMDDEDNLKYLKRKADCMIQTNRHEDAVPILYKIHYLDEQSIEIRSELALCLFMSGKYDKAKEMYHLLSIEYPNDYQILVNLANVYFYLGEIKTAFTYYSEAYHILSNEEQGKKKFKRIVVDAAKLMKPLGIDMEKFQMIYDAVCMKV